MNNKEWCSIKEAIELKSQIEKMFSLEIITKEQALDAIRKIPTFEDLLKEGNV